MLADEEARAAEYRRQVLARARFKLGAELALRGNDAALTALRAKWLPVREWLEERRDLR